MINKERKILTIEYEKNEKFKKLIWKLWKYPKISEFLRILPKLEKKIYMLKEYEREEYILELISSIIEEKELINYYKKRNLIIIKKLIFVEIQIM